MTPASPHAFSASSRSGKAQDSVLGRPIGGGPCARFRAIAEIQCGVDGLSAYLKFFQLECSPFDTGPQSSVVLGTRALRDAYAQIEAGLSEQAPRICVDGGAGLGKTSLARAMPKLLRDQARVALLLNPALSWATLKSAIVRQLDLEGGVLSRASLVERRRGGQRIVIVIDAAEKISGESLEHLDILLAYRSDDDEQLVHCVLLANLEHARQQPECPLLWWLDSLNTLQLEFAPIPVDGVRSYIVKHLKRAGWTGGDLFSSEAARAIHRLTGGVPRSVSELCERVLIAAAEQGVEQIDAGFVEAVRGEQPFRPAADPDSEHEDEVVLEQVATTTIRGSTPPHRADDETSDTGGRAPRPDPRADPTLAARPAPPRPAGLDAYFGPESQAAAAAAVANAESESDDGAEPFVADASLDSDVRVRGGAVRWLAAAAVLLVLIGAGLAFTGVFGQDDPGESTTAQADAPESAEAPSNTGAIGRKAAKGSAAAVAQVETLERKNRGLDASADARADRSATPREMKSGSVGDSSAAPNDLAQTPAPDVERPHDAAAPPAAPAPLDLMDRSTEHHF